MCRRSWSRKVLLLLALALGVLSEAHAGGPFRKHARRQAVAVPTTRVVRNPSGMLGTFYPDPVLSIGGSGYVGGGYSPLDMYGLNTLSLDGPVSPYRAASAPVLTYSRGYDGRLTPDLGTSFSYPNQGELSPVVYPTRANYFYGFRRSGTPPEWDRAINWIDQN
jgi:hypothetical protein